jgi:energy-coupling factor transporter ATP-binding protein EcfA2
MIVTIYGEDGIGKTTLAMTANDSVLIDTDGGSLRALTAQFTRIYPAPTAADVLSVIAKLDSSVKTVVLDSVTRTMDLLTEDIIQNDSGVKPVYHQQKDRVLNLKGFGLLSTRFKQLLNSMTTKGYNVVLVAHVKEERTKDAVTYRPQATGQTADFITQNSQAIGFMFFEGSRRYISFTGNDSWYAKSPHACFPTKVEVLERDLITVSNGELQGFMQTILDTLINSERNQQKKVHYGELMKQRIAEFEEGKNLTVEAVSKCLVGLQYIELEVMRNFFRAKLDRLMAIAKNNQPNSANENEG